MHLPRGLLFQYAVYLAVRVLSVLLHAAGWRASYRAGRVFAWLLYRLDHRHRRIALENLAAAYPHLEPARRRRIAQASFRSLVYMGIETLFSVRAVTPTSWARRILLRDMSEPIRLMSQGRGVILVTCHFGNFEVAGRLTAAIGLPTVTVARRIDNPFLHRYVIELREQAGQRILDKDGAARRAPAVLESGGTLVLVPDQDAGPRGVFVDFFGRPAATVKTVALLAAGGNRPLCVITCRRLDEDYHFEVACTRVLRPADWADQADPIRWITQQFTAAFERAVRQAPEQYFWMHNRWKTPPGRLKRIPGQPGRWILQSR